MVVKKKSPRFRRLQVQMVRRIGFRASASRIRTGFARLPACSPARYGRSASASRSRLDRGSNPCMVAIKEKPPFPEASSSSGAAYRIRTYDVLIRSQTLYPAEVTPQRKTYKTTLVSWSQAQSQTFFENMLLTQLRMRQHPQCDQSVFQPHRTRHRVPSKANAPAGRSHNRQTRCSACALPG